MESLDTPSRVLPSPTQRLGSLLDHAIHHDKPQGSSIGYTPVPFTTAKVVGCCAVGSTFHEQTRASLSFCYHRGSTTWLPRGQGAISNYLPGTSERRQLRPKSGLEAKSRQ